MTTSPPPRHSSPSRAESFHFAFNGMWHLLRTQPNAWIHTTATMCVVALGVWLGLSQIEWAILVLTIGLVWMAEAFNTALEATVDLASPETHPLARIGKDVGAGAVLFAALTAVIVGILILGPHLLGRLVRH